MPLLFNTAKARFLLLLAQWFQPKVRSFARWRHSLRWRGKVPLASQPKEFILIDRMERRNDYESRWWSNETEVGRLDVLRALESDGWQALENDSDWDLQRDELRALVASEPHFSGIIILARIEMGEGSQGQLPVDFVRTMESLGLQRMRMRGRVTIFRWHYNQAMRL